MDELEPESKRFATAWSQTMGVKLQELSECMSSLVVYTSYLGNAVRFSRGAW